MTFFPCLSGPSKKGRFSFHLDPYLWAGSDFISKTELAARKMQLCLAEVDINVATTVVRRGIAQPMHRPQNRQTHDSFWGLARAGWGNQLEIDRSGQ